MNPKIYFLVSGIIFLVVALLHLLRIILGWEAVFAGWMVPMWFSWAALVISSYLAYMGIRLSKRSS